MFGKKVTTMVGKKRTIEQEVVVDRKLRIRFFSFKKKSVTSFFISRTFFFYIFLFCCYPLVFILFCNFVYVQMKKKVFFCFKLDATNE